MTPDVNVLIAAARPDHSLHASAKAWLAATLADGAGLLLFPMVLTSFVRLVIHPKIFLQPTTPSGAFAWIDQLLAAPGARMPPLGAEWRRMQTMYTAIALKPNDVPDVWLAAAVQEHGDHLVTFDTGFRRLLKRSELTILR